MGARNSYFQGQLVHLTAAYTVGLPPVLTDPTTVTVKVRAPDGTETTATPTKDSVGNYHYDVNANQAGTWFYGFYGTGTCQAAYEKEFAVPSPTV